MYKKIIKNILKSAFKINIMCYITIKGILYMLKYILRLMYNSAPMNFYTKSNGKTVIRAINNITHGYEFDREFMPEELATTWEQIKLHKRISSIFICLLFIYLLYEAIFPQFPILVNNKWYVNAIILILIMVIVGQIITYISAKIFEKRIKMKFGEFKRSKFTSTDRVDKTYYNIFKNELIKVLIVILILVIGFVFISPFSIAKRLLKAERYNEVITFTSICAKVFPIAQEWYTMRGYAKFKLGNNKDAAADFTKAYRLGADGSNMTNFDNSIYIKYIEKDYDSEIKDFNREIKKAETEEEKDKFKWDKAQFLYNIGRYEEALDIYNDLITKAEDDRVFLLKDRLYFERAQTYQKLGKEQESIADIESSGISQEEAIDYVIPEPMLIIDSLEQ